MEVEIRLARILKEFGLDRHGIVQRMAKDIGVHRHTIRKLLASQLTNPGLDTLGYICDWLCRNGVPADRLPHELFGIRPSELWRAVSSSEVVCLYVGEYRQMEPPARTWRWIAQHDAVAVAKLVQWLSSSGNSQHHLSVAIEYVPFRFVQGSPSVKTEHLDEDIRVAKAIYQQMQEASSHRNAVLIGSQRANHLVELLVADLFGCKPFVARENRRPHVPFYLAYRDDDRVVPSCFGGRDAPAACKDAAGPGIYYLNADRQWAALPWKEHSQDAGLVIIVRDPGTTAVQMALFGFTGWSTELLGGQLLRDTAALWPLPEQVGGREVGVYLYRFSFPTRAQGDEQADAAAKSVDVIPIDRGILKEYLG